MWPPYSALRSLCAHPSQQLALALVQHFALPWRRSLRAGGSDALAAFSRHSGDPSLQVVGLTRLWPLRAALLTISSSLCLWRSCGRFAPPWCQFLLGRASDAPVAPVRRSGVHLFQVVPLTLLRSLALD